MKHSKKLFSGLLALVLVCGVCLSAMGAAEDLTGGTEGQTIIQPRTESAFSDVAAGAWFEEAAVWCRDNGIMSGTTDTTFSPNSTMTRAMLAAVLYRAAGSPAVTGGASFTDVADNAYYHDAAGWASANGIISGYGNGLFGSNDPLTREQLAAILWRYDGSPEAEIGENFADEASIASYASTAVDWARAEGVISGMDGNRFAPQGSATRAQVAVILCRYLTDEETGGDGATGGSDAIVTNGGEEIALSSLAHRTTDSDAPQVFYLSDISPQALMEAYEALNWTPTGNVAVKLSTGEPPASNYLDPALIADVVHEVNGTIVENNTAYGGSRASTAMHYQVAEEHGFTAIADFQILDEDGSMTLPVSGGTQLTENYVGAAFADYDSYLVLSHFKGHSMAGFGGAIKNISIGLGSAEGKSWIHSAGHSRTSPWGGDQDAFLESMGDAGKAVSDYLGNGDRIVYINVMNRLSVDCDCNGRPAEPDMHDIGILASTDPVALDQACVDLVYASQDGGSLIQRMESRNGIHTLENAETIGLGSRSYQLVDIG